MVGRDGEMVVSGRFFAVFGRREGKNRFRAAWRLCAEILFWVSGLLRNRTKYPPRIGRYLLSRMVFWPFLPRRRILRSVSEGMKGRGRPLME